MNILFWLFLSLLVYLFYIVVKSKYKLLKRNGLKYDEHTLQIPQHLCAVDNDLIFGEIESCSESGLENSTEVKYKKIRWDDIKSWEYKFITHTNFNHTIYLGLITSNQKISVTGVQGLMKMKRYFKKYAPGKRIVNLSNKLELPGTILSFLIVIFFLYFFIFS